MVNDTLGQWLKEKCREEHLSLRQAAERVGVSHSTICDIVKGGHPSAETVTKLARAFGGNGNQRIALEDELLVLAGYRTREPKFSQARGELLDTVRDFSELKLKVVIAFAKHLTSIT